VGKNEATTLETAFAKQSVIFTYFIEVGYLPTSEVCIVVIISPGTIIIVPAVSHVAFQSLVKQVQLSH